MNTLAKEIIMTPLMDARGRRITKRMEELGYDQYDLARMCATEQPSISRYINGIIRKAKFLPELAKALQTTTDWIETGKEVAPLKYNSMPQHAGLLINNIVTIPEYSIDSPASEGALFTRDKIIGDQIISLYQLKESGKNNTNGLAAIKAPPGDSMSPTIREGDILLVDTEEKSPNREAVYVFSDVGGVSVKRVQPLPGGRISILSDNNLYKPYEMDANQARIEGRVLLITTSRKP